MTSVTNGSVLAVQATTLALAVLSLALSWWAARQGCPVRAVFGRWARWFFLAMLAAGILYTYNWTGYGFPVLFAVSLLALFLVETAYNWMAISALSKSELPIFPKFEENERGDDWPNNRAFIKLKTWLRETGFQKRQSLVSKLGETVLMKALVFENENQTTRLQVVLLPNPRGNPALCMTLVSVSKTGDTLVTDNIFLPFGGFYPESWQVERRPWIRSADKLFQRHRERIDANGEKLLPFVTTPLEQINEDQRIVEQLNRDLGFIHSPAEEIEYGRLTAAGKSRIWQEVWTLSYLGLPLKYS